MTVIEFTTRDQLREQLRADIEREQAGMTIAEEALDLSGSLRKYVRAAWPLVEQRARYVHGYHIDAMCDHLEAVTAGEIRRLQIWVPPGSMKSNLASIFWPTWEWTTKPWLRLLTGSYDIDLSTRFAVRSRTLMQAMWYRQRWGDEFDFVGGENVKRSYVNTKGGERFATSPTAGATGRHADRILIDDPINAMAADATSRTVIDEANAWYDGSLSMRSTDAKTHAEVIIMQRLARGDFAEHVLQYEDWTVLCLPERYEPKHPFVVPANVKLPSGREIQGDVRSEPGQLLWPDRVGELENQVRAKKLGAHRAAGQLQQRPAAREGSIFKRAHWRYFDRDLLADPGVTSSGLSYRNLPRFPAIVSSWDTTFKAKNSSDYVCGGIWGITPADRYLLRIVHGHMSLSEAKSAMKELRQWGLERFPQSSHRVLVENTANGPEIIAQLKREIPGVIATSPSVAADQPAVSKTVRAEACEPDFEAGNVFVAGAPSASLDGYDSALTDEPVQALIEEAADFPNAPNDDRVDMLTQLLNWARENSVRPARVARASSRDVQIGGLVR